MRFCAWFLKQGPSLLASPPLPFSIKESCIFEDQCSTKNVYSDFVKTQRSKIDALWMVFFSISLL